MQSILKQTLQVLMQVFLNSPQFAKRRLPSPHEHTIPWCPWPSTVVAWSEFATKKSHCDSPTDARLIGTSCTLHMPHASFPPFSQASVKKMSGTVFFQFVHLCKFPDEYLKPL